METPLPGHVKSVRVEAFKCHDHFEVEFGCMPPFPVLQPVRALSECMLTAAGQAMVSITANGLGGPWLVVAGLAGF